MALTNLFGDLALDTSIKSLLQKFGRFSFDTSSQLRTTVAGTVAISSGTVTTCTTANMSIGDSGKASTIQLQSAQGFYGSVGANFLRS